ncbi:metallophosphoesterase [Kocuria sabuli]|uniref:metallophosphoesterase family protein n=2 Tax=Kocuria TaxID=57493 RepID=UPI0034D54061
MAFLQPAEEPRTGSSRVSPGSAGWGCGQAADIRDLFRDRRVPAKPLWWFHPKVLWASRNDRIAHWITDPTDYERGRWVRARLAAGVDPELTVGAYAEEDQVSFLVLGDTGEGDSSQYHVVRPMLARSEGISFTYLVSDIIYPAGDVLDYEDKLFRPYQRLPGPIYAVPGNHDWYDGLHGFMTLLCDADPDLRPPADQELSRWRRWLLAVLWRRVSSRKRQEQLQRMRDVREGLRPARSEQPAPYFSIELKELLLVGIDTGIRGELDAEQGQWLRKVSAAPKDKILVTGKPLVVNARRKDIRIDGIPETVRDIVDDPAHRYIATIGGDTHNYQRYPVVHDDGRVLQHLVTGAGGAYTKATHIIPRATVEECGCDEADFRCYPLRGDSLATYSILFDRRFGFRRGRFVVPRQQAPAVMAERLGGGLEPTRETDRGATVSPKARRAARVVHPLSARTGPLYRFFSEFLDWDTPDPPLFKSFLRIDVRPGELEIKCCSATGCAEHESDPPLEDHVRGTRTGEGRWSWREFPPAEVRPTGETSR